MQPESQPPNLLVLRAVFNFGVFFRDFSGLDNYTVDGRVMSAFLSCKLQRNLWTQVRIGSLAPVLLRFYAGAAVRQASRGRLAGSAQRGELMAICTLRWTARFAASCSASRCDSLCLSKNIR